MTTDRIAGRMGSAERIPVLDGAQGAETVTLWLITAPAWAPPLIAGPIWTQWVLGCVRLRDSIPGFPPPRRKFDGATHEILVMSLNPEHGPYSVDDFRIGRVGFLEPQNVVVQFIATDTEMLKVTDVAAQAVVGGS